MSEEVDTSAEACALACMIVSNPAGAMRHVGWQKRVNDLIRALRNELDAEIYRSERTEDELAAARKSMTDLAAMSVHVSARDKLRADLAACIARCDAAEGREQQARAELTAALSREVGANKMLDVTTKHRDEYRKQYEEAHSENLRLIAELAATRDIRKFTDDELRSELFRRATDFAGDPMKGVTISARIDVLTKGGGE